MPSAEVIDAQSSTITKAPLLAPAIFFTANSRLKHRFVLLAGHHRRVLINCRQRQLAVVTYHKLQSTGQPWYWPAFYSPGIWRTDSPRPPLRSEACHPPPGLNDWFS